MHPMNPPGPKKDGTKWNTFSLDKELGGLLRQIEKETIPERLLDLAQQLQTALNARCEEQEK